MLFLEKGNIERDKDRHERDTETFTFVGRAMASFDLFAERLCFRDVNNIERTVFV